MINILKDVSAAVEAFGAIRRARKRGANRVKIEVKAVKTLPVVTLSYWGQTMEGCLFTGKEWKPVRDVFDSLDADTQRALTFTPQDGRWADRARFWQEQMKPALPPEIYHRAMLKLTHWFAHCVRMRLEAAK